MIVGAGANIAVQVGDDGVLVVDTGEAGTSDKVLAAIKQLAPGKEIRWVINTGMTANHTGGNEAISKAGRTVNGNIAAIVAHENTAARMIKAGVPDAARPFNTYFEASRDFPFNGEPIMLYPRRIDIAMIQARWSCSGDPTSSRRAMSSAPRATRSSTSPTAAASTATIAALNRILDLTVPSKMLEEARHLRHPGSRTHQRRARRRDVSRHARDHPRSDPQHGREENDARAGEGGAADARLRRPLRCRDTGRGRRRCSSRPFIAK